MNRHEVLFQGRRVDNGEWVEGFLLKGNHTYIATLDAIDYMVVSISGAACVELVEVNPETVGQYVGVFNIPSGKKLFEGNVLRYFDDEVQVIEWNDDFKRVMLHTYSLFDVKRGRKVVQNFQEGWSDLEDYPLEKMEYLGRIFDNPELIEPEYIRLGSDL